MDADARIDDLTTLYEWHDYFALRSAREYVIDFRSMTFLLR